MNDTILEIEQARWQEAIYKLMSDRCPRLNVDGAGCDSGDPLDFSIAEISQGLGCLNDQIEAQKQRADKAEGEVKRLQSIIQKTEAYWMDHARIQGVSHSIYNETIAPIKHLWNEFNQPPGIGMICAKMIEVIAERDQWKAEADRLILLLAATEPKAQG